MLIVASPARPTYRWRLGSMRRKRLRIAVLAVSFLLATCANATNTGTPVPSTPSTIDSLGSSEPRPLPPPVGEHPPEELPNSQVRYWANSAPVEQGIRYRITVGTHCGFGPIDFDGSFFEADAAADTQDLPDPEDTGEIILESDDEALYLSSTGLKITMTRMTFESVDKDVCM